jgi:hypothetical protein
MEEELLACTKKWLRFLIVVRVLFFGFNANVAVGRTFLRDVATGLAQDPNATEEEINHRLGHVHSDRLAQLLQEKDANRNTPLGVAMENGQRPFIIFAIRQLTKSRRGLEKLFKLLPDVLHNSIMSCIDNGTMDVVFRRLEKYPYLVYEILRSECISGDPLFHVLVRIARKKRFKKSLAMILRILGKNPELLVKLLEMTDGYFPQHNSISVAECKPVRDILVKKLKNAKKALSKSQPILR